MNKMNTIFSLILWGTLTICTAELSEEKRPGRENFLPSRPPVERYLNSLKAKDPDEHKRLVNLQQEDPEKFRMELRNKAYKLRKGPHHREKKRLHPLSQEIESVKKAQNPEERALAVTSLRKAITKRVEKNLEEREQAIAKIREKLKQLENRNELERTSREEIINHHLQRILENIEKFESSPPPDK